jgi:uncharacterized membrane protein
MRGLPAEYNHRVQRSLAAVLTLGAMLWVATLLVAPIALQRSRGASTGSVLIYQAARLICHQRPERSFHLAGVQLPVCARCMGLYLSGAAGALAAWSGRRRRVAMPRGTRTVLVLGAIPTALTVAIEFAGLTHSSNTVRFVSALPLGVAAGWIFVRSLRAEAGDGAVATSL